MLLVLVPAILAAACPPAGQFAELLSNKLSAGLEAEPQ
jgi:hypothetical protein